MSAMNVYSKIENNSSEKEICLNYEIFLQALYCTMVQLTSSVQHVSFSHMYSLILFKVLVSTCALYTSKKLPV